MSKRSFIKKLTALSLCLCTTPALGSCEIPFLSQNAGITDVQNQFSVKVTPFTEPVSLIGEPIQAYLQASPDQLVTNFLPDNSFRYDQGQPVIFNYNVDNFPQATTIKRIVIEFSFTEDFSNITHKEIFTPQTTDEELAMYNLQTGKTYYFRFTITLEDGSKATDTGVLQTLASPRFIRLEGASNVRDIGGWKTVNGKTIQQGLLYRGSEIDGGKNTGHPDFCLTTNGIRQLRALGIKTDFDLRSESNKVSEYSALGEDVQRTFYNADQYETITVKATAGKVKKIFSDLAKPEIYPVYLHCTHGVDRAGSTTMLLEALLGVPKEDLIRDYELSAFYYNYKQVNRHIETGGNILTLMEELEEYPGESFADKVASFLLSTGVTQAEIDSIRNIFLV